MAHDTNEKKSENEGESAEEKESEAEDKLDEQVEDSGEKEKDSEEEGDEEVNSDEDDLSLSAIGKKSKKAPVKATKSIVPTRKEVAPPARTPLARRDESDSTLQEKTSAQKRKAVKTTREATTAKKADKGK
ncbi:PREDICTED: histone chaperone ASF1-like [Nicotiana attenuata]|uniref:histone chaperone ASF1-like n=1 Tax=Nicotiana attenuata TaxID=49451 RepID=UPI0009058787|nr:PREDICTED: histone chaperone ASF1-like [Nicotiana attenuata]